MARTISFLVLVAVIVLLSIIFFRVMAGFLIPMFLAAILCIVFEPVHRWFLDKCGRRPKLAASLTSASVLLVVLVPAVVLLTLAVLESREIVGSLDANSIKEKTEKLRTSLNLQHPFRNEFTEVDDALGVLTGDARSENWQSKLSSLEELRAENAELLARLDESSTVSPAGTARTIWESAFENYQSAVERCREHLLALIENDFKPTLATDEEQDSSTEDKSSQADAKKTGDDSELSAEPEIAETAYEAKLRTQREYRLALDEASIAFREFRTKFLGGRFWATARVLANPSPEDAEKYARQIQDTATDMAWSFGGATTSFLGSLVIGLGIMIVSMYFFLLDGPSLIQKLKFLSPMDDEHEDELLDEFRNVSRAVVMATLLAAIVQGILAGIGYYFAGIHSVFLLTVLTTVLALVPFVGATAVWIPASLWLYFMDERPVAAIGLAIYGFSVVSTVDNFIKPYVLHGQSNLHPLLALLSVLGGVSAMGPIGILVGPMIVVFLQTLLKILQRELSSMESWPQFGNGNPVTANGDSADKQSANQQTAD